MTSLNPDILSLDPIPMPKPVLRAPEGETLDLEEVTRLAGMKYVVSNPGGFSIRLVPGNRDLIERRPGFRVYAIGRDGIPEDPRAGSREILRRLAYAFHDWAAREIVARYHRDLKRDDQDRQRVSVVTLIRNALSMEDGATVGRLARMTGVAQSNISRALRVLEKKNVVCTERSGRETMVFLKSKAEQN